MKRFVVVLLVLGLVVAPGAVVADHGGAHGYCVDDVPVVTHWPEKYQGSEYHEPICVGGNFAVAETFESTEFVELGTRDQPADFGGWARVWLNGVALTNPYRDVFPYVVHSSARTLIPIRMVTEAMGGTATWDGAGDRVTIRLGERYMEMTIGQPDAIANGVAVTLDQPPMLWKDRTMVPLRVLAEAFGATVIWDPKASAVYVTLEGVTCQPGYCVKLWS